MMCISPYFRFPPYFRKNFGLRGKFSQCYHFQQNFTDFHPPKFLATFSFFYSFTTNFEFPPPFSVFQYIISRNFSFSPYFSKFRPDFVKFTYFLCFSFPPLL